MNKIIILVVLGLAVILGGAFYFFNKNQQFSTQKPAEITAASISKPWIEVVAPAVFELKPADESKIRELKTGDELSAGSKIETGPSAMANIHFPDGSVARFEPGTKFVLSEASYDSQSEKLVVKITLSVGRVWSKIIALVTPDSAWEVKTANTVATVRGTAFGVGFFNGKSRIFGSENTIKVAVADPKTGEAIKGTEVVVSPDKFLEVKNEDIPVIKTKPEIIAVRDLPAELAKEDFFKRNKEADEVIDKKIDELEKSGLKEKDLREVFRESVIEGFKTELQERRIEKESEMKKEEGARTENKAELNKSEEINKAENLPEEEKPRELEAAPSSGGPAAKALNLAVVSKNDLSHVVEGDAVNFEAIVTMSDGRKINVTATAKWQVLGQMGKISGPGVFIAELAPEVAEFGESSGAVVATWRDPESGESLLGKSPIFKVEAKVPEVINREG